MVGSGHWGGSWGIQSPSVSYLHTNGNDRVKRDKLVQEIGTVVRTESLNHQISRSELQR